MRWLLPFAAALWLAMFGLTSGFGESNLTYFGAPRLSITGVPPTLDITEGYILAQTNTSVSKLSDQVRCSAVSPCVDGSCCNSNGLCGYRPEHCRPDAPASCVSDCDATAPCGEFSADGTMSCPLNLCCSYFGFCGASEPFCRGQAQAQTGIDAPCQGNCGDTQTPSCGQGSGSATRKIAYYETWNSRRRDCDKAMPNQLDTTGLTHLILAFADIDPKSFEIGLMNPNDDVIYEQFLALPGGLRKIIGLGGWEFSDLGVSRFTWSEMTSSRENRKSFIDSLQHFLSKYKFTGVDIDWEWPGASDRGGNSADKENLVALVTELRKAMGSGFSISVNVPAQYDYLKGMDVNGLEAQVDWLNMLTYNLHGPWDANLPGFGPYMKPHTDLKEIDKVLELLWSAKVNPKNVVMALANYGRGYTAENKDCVWYGCKFTGPSRAGACTKEDGILSTCEIRRIISQHNLTPVLIDGGAGVKQIAWDDQWANYDDAETFDLKLKLANDRCLGGTALWALDYAVCGDGGGSPQPGSSVAPAPPVATGTTKVSAGLPASSSSASVSIPLPSSQPPPQQSSGASSNVPSTPATWSNAAPLPPAQSSWSTVYSSASSTTHGSSAVGSNAPTLSSVAPSGTVTATTSEIGTHSTSNAATSSHVSSWSGSSSADSTASASSSAEGGSSGVPVIVPVPVPTASSASSGVTSSHQTSSHGSTVIAPTVSSSSSSTTAVSSIAASMASSSGAQASSSVPASRSGEPSSTSASWQGTSVTLVPTVPQSDGTSSQIPSTEFATASFSSMVSSAQSVTMTTGSTTMATGSTSGDSSSSTGAIVILPIPIPVPSGGSQPPSSSNVATWPTNSNAVTLSTGVASTSIVTRTSQQGTSSVVSSTTTIGTSDGTTTTTVVTTDLPSPSGLTPIPIILPPPGGSSTLLFPLPPCPLFPVTWPCQPVITSSSSPLPICPIFSVAWPCLPAPTSSSSTLPTPFPITPLPAVPTDDDHTILVPAIVWSSDSHSDTDPECVPNDCVATCLGWRAISMATLKRPMCPCIPHTCDKKTNNKKKKCKLFGCGCGWGGISFGPGCDGDSFHLFGILPPTGLFGVDLCPLFGCPDTTPGRKSGLIGSNGYCFGGCEPCPPEICRGNGPLPGLDPAPPSNQPTECAEKDKTRVTERFMYCIEFYNVSVSAVSTSVLGTTSTMTSSACVPLIEATLKVCPGLMDGYTTTTTTTMASTATSTSSDAPACTRAPLSLDDDEGSNDDPLSSSIRYSSNTTGIASSTVFSSGTFFASSSVFLSSVRLSSSSGQSSGLSQSTSGMNSSSWVQSPTSTLSSSWCSSSTSASALNTTQSSTWATASSSAKSSGSSLSSSRVPSSSSTGSSSSVSSSSLMHSSSSTSSSSWMQSSSSTGPSSSAPSSSSVQSSSWIQPSSSSTKPSSSSIKPSSSSIKSSSSSTETASSSAKPTSSSAQPSSTTKKPQPTPSKPPMDRNDRWKAKIAVRMQRDHAEMGWTLYDPKGFEAGGGWKSAQDSEIHMSITSQNRPIEESARYAVTMIGRDLLNVDKARVTFIIEQPLEKCKFADGNPCRPSMTTENRPETEMFEVDSCEFYCMNKEDVKLFQADLWCDDLNQSMWLPWNAGFERIFWCGWKGY